MQKLNHDRSCAASPFFNSLLEPIGNIPPAEAEERYYATLDGQKLAA
jgi:hypothetical protein